MPPADLPARLRAIARRSMPVVAVVLLGASGAACGSSGGTSSGTSVTITLYNGQHQQTTAALIAAFQRQTGIKVRERDGNEDQLVEEVQQEGSRSPADVIYTENSPALMSLSERGLLSPLPSDALSEVPARYSSPAGDWLGVSARVSVLVYNTGSLKASEVPTSVWDLADPRWKGKLALSPTETDFQPVVTSLVKSGGSASALAWLKAVKSNAASHIDADNEAVTADVNSGQAQIGLVDQYYWFRLAAENGLSSMHSAVAYFAPGDTGYVMDVSGAGVLKSSRHQSAAEEFVAFLASVAGQKVIVASDSFEYPLKAGVAASPGLQPFAGLQPNPISVGDLGDGSGAVSLEQKAQLL